MAGLENTRAPKAAYFELGRDEVLGLLPQVPSRVLDVGCAAGGTAPVLRAKGVETIHGVELVEEQAHRAAEVLDRVWTGAIEEQAGQLDGPYDAVLCLDVLEHLVDPYAVLSQLRAQTRDGGTLLVSLPNARYVGLIFDLWFRGTWGYASHGHRDWTHVRWFTSKDAIAAIQDAGFEVVRVHAPTSPRRWRAWLRRRPLIADFECPQLHYVAVAR